MQCRLSAVLSTSLLAASLLAAPSLEGAFAEAHFVTDQTQQHLHAAAQVRVVFDEQDLHQRPY